MVNLSELGLPDEKFDAPVVLDELPEQIGGFELLHPGTYLFTLPDNLEGVWPNGVWERKQTAQQTRISANFRKSKDTDFDGRLKAVLPGDNGKPLERHVSVSLNNIPMGKLASKLDYLLSALGSKETLDSNAAYVEALVKFSGHSFIADVIWTAWDKSTNQSFSTRPYENKKTGKIVKPIPRGADGKFKQEFEEDGVLLRCRLELENIRAAR